MLRIDPNKHIGFCLSALLFLLILVLTAPAIPRAEEKTPPAYPEGYRDKRATDSKPDSHAQAKDFRSLFTRPAASGTDKTPPYYGEGEKKPGRAPSKAHDEALTERLSPIDDKGFQTQEYVVREGDWLAKILREKALVKDENLPQLLSVLRELNSSLHSLDVIQPGEKIVILVKVVPDGESEDETPQQLKYETYRMKRGDILSRVAMRRYGLSKEQFNREYLNLFAACNPSIDNPNELSVGETIRLPLYPATYTEPSEKAPVLRDLEKSPHHRVALKAPARSERVQPPRQPPPESVKPAAAPPKPAPAPLKASAQVQEPVRSQRSTQATIIITDGLGTVVSRMGEEWVQSGEHIIPMKSGGNIHLKADSYPLARLQKGSTVIVDMQSALPEKMARILESTWANYRVVQLSASDGLPSALDKVLSAFSYPKVMKKGEPLALGGDIPINITGDLIVTLPPGPSGKGPGFIVINLMDRRDQALPRAIKDYLKQVGVEVIEYPAIEETPSEAGASSTAQTATDTAALIRTVLELMDLPFTTEVNIPAYTTRNKDFKFTVQADFYLEIWGRRYIIDRGSLSPDVVSLLKEDGFSVLSLAQEKKPVEMVSRILEFLDVRFQRGPHAVMAKKGDVSKNVKLSLSGVTFYDHKGNLVLATSVNLPPEIIAFLSQRGYHLLVLSPFAPVDSGSA